MRYLLLTLCIAGCASAAANANPSKIELATRLVELMDVAATIAGSADTTADAMIAQNPTLRPYKSTIVEWFELSFAGGKFESRMAEIYAEAFTAAELDSIASFYRTPAGRKMVRLQPELFRKGAELGQEIGAQNAGLLQEMIATKASELERLDQ